MDISKVPDQVILNPSLTLEQKGLYALLSVLTKAGKPVTMSGLAQQAGCASVTLRRHLAALVASGLVTVSTARDDRRAQIVALTAPLESKAAAMIRAATRRLGLARRRIRDGVSKESVGEALMKEWLTLLIAVKDFTDNARPGFLVSPLTGEPLEYDRWYPSLKLAWEFHGAQHFRTGDHQPDPQQLARQQANDMIKIGLSQREGVTLVEVQARDLSLDRMAARIPPGVPRQPLEGLESVVSFLEEESARYRMRAGVAG